LSKTSSVRDHGRDRGRHRRPPADRVAAGELRADLPCDTAARGLFGPLLVFLLTSGHLDDGEWVERASAYADEVADVWLRGALPAPR
jgi:hypothetical protein